MRMTRTKKTEYLRLAWTLRAQIRIKRRCAYGRLRPFPCCHRRYRPCGRSSGGKRGMKNKTQRRTVTCSSSDWSASRHPASNRSSKQMQTPMTIAEHTVARAPNYRVLNGSWPPKFDARLPRALLHRLAWDCRCLRSTTRRMRSALVCKGRSDGGALGGCGAGTQGRDLEGG